MRSVSGNDELPADYTIFESVLNALSVFFTKNGCFHRVVSSNDRNIYTKLQDDTVVNIVLEVDKEGIPFFAHVRGTRDDKSFYIGILAQGDTEYAKRVFVDFPYRNNAHHEVLYQLRI